jgi:hypothetical protein
VRHYRYQVRTRIPDERLFEGFSFSGNYRVELWEEEGNVPLASRRFFVVENVVRPRIRVSNRQLPSEGHPLNQVHRIDVAFKVPDQDSVTSQAFYPQEVRRVDVYRNLEHATRRSVDIDDDDPWTFVEGFGTRNLVFRVENVLPGNEYRRIDLRSVDQYPEGIVLSARGGADVSRFLARGSADRDGGFQLVQGNRYADYVPFRFELLWDGEPLETLHVTGSFADWELLPSLKMTREGERYSAVVSMRRGIHDYQYVAGGRDWISLEGNDWRTTNNYSVFVYYRETRTGGYDRIIGHARQRSSGKGDRASD